MYSRVSACAGTWVLPAAPSFPAPSSEWQKSFPPVQGPPRRPPRPSSQGLPGENGRKKPAPHTVPSLLRAQDSNVPGCGIWPPSAGPVNLGEIDHIFTVTFSRGLGPRQVMRVRGRSSRIHGFPRSCRLADAAPSQACAVTAPAGTSPAQAGHLIRTACTWLSAVSVCAASRPVSLFPKECFW